MISNGFDAPGFLSAQVFVPDGFVWPSPLGRPRFHGTLQSLVRIADDNDGRANVNGEKPPVHEQRPLPALQVHGPREGRAHRVLDQRRRG